MNKPIVAGIGSIARVGKDLLAELLVEKFQQEGYTAKRYALANELKRDCEHFLRDKLGLDVWTNDTEEKAKFRDFLVWYGKIKREASSGTYWTGKLQESIDADFAEFFEKGGDPSKFAAIVSDIRYSDPRFSGDEVSWIKDEMGGIIINLDRRLPDGTMVQPANKDEEANSARVRCAACLEVAWETKPVEYLKTEYVTPIFNFIVDKIIN